MSKWLNIHIIVAGGPLLEYPPRCLIYPIQSYLYFPVVSGQKYVLADLDLNCPLLARATRATLFQERL